MEKAIDALARAVGALHLEPASKLQTKRRNERLRRAEEAVSIILAEPHELIVDTRGRYILRNKGNTGAYEDDSDAEAMEILDHFRRAKISTRSMLMLPRACRRKTLRRMQRTHIPYKPRVIVFQPGLGRARAGAVVKLRDLVEARVALAELGTELQLTKSKMWILLAVDATPFWRTSATRGDAYVDLYAQKGYVGIPARWSTWFVFDGADDAEPLRIADQVAQLNRSVEDLLKNGVAVQGTRVECEVFLTGDGKGMAAGNHKQGCRCWVCELAFDEFSVPEKFNPSDYMPPVPRWGAFLRCIPVTHRIGDWVHAACRIANAFLKRLRDDPRVTAQRALVSAIKDLIRTVTLDASHIPSDMRLAPRPTTEGKLDLTAARVFLRAPTRHAQLVRVLADHAKDAFVSVGDARVPFHIVVHRILASLSYIHKIWAEKEGLTPAQVTAYGVAVGNFVRDWKALGWRVTVWVHWLGVHSTAVAKRWGTFYFFSSIPTERRNVEFKMDIRHCFLGWKLSKPKLTRRALAHAVELSILDVGLARWRLLRKKGRRWRWGKYRRTSELE